MKKFIIRILKNERIERAFKTFIEAFFSYIAINLATTNITSKSGLYALFSGAVASAISVLINYKKTKST